MEIHMIDQGILRPMAHTHKQQFAGFAWHGQSNLVHVPVVKYPKKIDITANGVIGNPRFDPWGTAKQAMMMGMMPRELKMTTKISLTPCGLVGLEMNVHSMFLSKSGEYGVRKKLKINKATQRPPKTGLKSQLGSSSFPSSTDEAFDVVA